MKTYWNRKNIFTLHGRNWAERQFRVMFRPSNGNNCNVVALRKHLQTEGLWGPRSLAVGHSTFVTAAATVCSAACLRHDNAWAVCDWSVVSRHSALFIGHRQKTLNTKPPCSGVLSRSTHWALFTESTTVTSRIPRCRLDRRLVTALRGRYACATKSRATKTGRGYVQRSCESTRVWQRHRAFTWDATGGIRFETVARWRWQTRVDSQLHCTYLAVFLLQATFCRTCKHPLTCRGRQDGGKNISAVQKLTGLSVCDRASVAGVIGERKKLNFGIFLIQT